MFLGAMLLHDDKDRPHSDCLKTTSFHFKIQMIILFDNTA